jgi:hypothetical protein
LEGKQIRISAVVNSVRMGTNRGRRMQLSTTANLSSISCNFPTRQCSMKTDSGKDSKKSCHLSFASGADGAGARARANAQAGKGVPGDGTLPLSANHAPHNLAKAPARDVLGWTRAAGEAVRVGQTLAPAVSQRPASLFAFFLVRPWYWGRRRI